MKALWLLRNDPLEWCTPWKINGWNLRNLRIYPWKFGKSSEPNHHDFRFYSLIFGGVGSYVKMSSICCILEEIY